MQQKPEELTHQAKKKVLVNLLKLHLPLLQSVLNQILKLKELLAVLNQILKLKELLAVLNQILKLKELLAVLNPLIALNSSQKNQTMSESNRSMRKTKDGRKVITKTKANGKTVTRVKSAKDEDGKRSLLGTRRTRTKDNGTVVRSGRMADGTLRSKSRTKTKETGNTVTRKKTAGGRSSVTRTKADGATVNRRVGKSGFVKKVTKTKADGSTVTKGRSSARVITARKKAAAKKKLAAGETVKGRSGKLANLSAKIAKREAKGKDVSRLQERRGKVRKNMRSAVRTRRRNRRSSSED